MLRLYSNYKNALSPGIGSLSKQDPLTEPNEDKLLSGMRSWFRLLQSIIQHVVMFKYSKKLSLASKYRPPPVVPMPPTAVN